MNIAVEAAKQQHRFLSGAMLLAVLLAAWVNPGNLGNVDALRRLRMAHTWWAGGMEVLPHEAGTYGTMGSDGVKRGNFGVGHSLVLLPADMIVTPLVERFGLPAAGREAAIAFLTQATVACLLLAAAYSLLRRLGFDHRESGYGTVSLLLLTTALHYIQNAQENLLMATLAMSGTACLLKWREEDDGKALVVAGVLFGSSLLIRLTTLADAGAAAVMLLLLAGWRGALRAAPRFAAGFGMMVALERVIQFVRFGNWTGTYYSGMMGPAQAGGLRPAVFQYRFLKGVGRALLSQSDSVFLYDPLLTWTVILLVVFWKRIPRAMRSYSLGAASSLAVYVLFYATYQSPTGEASWGDRYVTTPVLLVALLAIPLTLRLMGRMPVWGWVLTGWSLALQLTSLSLVMALEWVQGIERDIPVTLALRFANMWMVWTGEAANSMLFQDVPAEWRTWNFLPFQLRFRFPGLADWAIAGWWVLGALCAVQAVRVLRELKQPKTPSTL